MRVLPFADRTPFRLEPRLESQEAGTRFMSASVVLSPVKFAFTTNRLPLFRNFWRDLKLLASRNMNHVSHDGLDAVHRLLSEAG